MSIRELERQTADDLARSLTHNPDAWSWKDSSCDALCGPNGIRVSICFFTVWSPAMVHFGFWNRRRIRRAFKAWKRDVGSGLADKERAKAMLLVRQSLKSLRAVA